MTSLGRTRLETILVTHAGQIVPIVPNVIAPRNKTHFFAKDGKLVCAVPEYVWADDWLARFINWISGGRW